MYRSAHTAPDTPVTCLLADDNQGILDALERVLGRAGVNVLGIAHTGVEALRLMELRPASAIVLDVRLHDLSGMDVAQLARDTELDTPLIFYTSHADRKLVRDALDAGVSGVVLKSASPKNLLRSISAVAAGQTYLDPELSSGLRKRTISPQ